jgi:hypothetical protein
MNLRLGPLPVLKTFGQRAVLPAWRDFEGTGDMLGRDAILAPLLNGRKPVLEGVHVAWRSAFAFQSCHFVSSEVSGFISHS